MATLEKISRFPVKGLSPETLFCDPSLLGLNQRYAAVG
jgi:hypothetical protein